LFSLPGKKGNGDNKHPSGKGSGASSEARNVNEVESTDGAEESGPNSPVDFATLDQSCLVDADNNNSPVVQAPAIPHGSGIKYIRLVFSKNIEIIRYLFSSRKSVNGELKGRGKTRYSATVKIFGNILTYCNFENRREKCARF
jgi:hypothetical protein